MLDPTVARATPPRLWALHRAGALSRHELEQALTRACAAPPHDAWTRFLERVLLAVGVSLVVAGLLTFVAFNWEAFGRMARFGLAGVWIVAGAGVAAIRGLDRFESRVALFASAVGVGALLAMIGQVYQTGADDWTLFASWAVLILPWLVVSRMPAMGVLVVALTNLSLGFWVGQVRPELADWMPVGVAGLDIAVAAAWMAGARWVPELDVRWAPRMILFVAVGALMVPAAVAAFVTHAPGLVSGTLLLGAGGVLVALEHLGRGVDRFVTTLTALALLVVMNVHAWSWLFQLGPPDPVLLVLLCGVTVIAQAVGFVTWFRSLPPASNEEVG